MKAVVLGATGAVGSQILGLLLCSGKWTQITTIGRRTPTISEKYPESEWKASVEHRVIDMDKLEEEAAKDFEGAHSVFCALGTTRADVESADAFRKVDLDYVTTSAKIAKERNVPHYSLLTSHGANPNTYANDWKIMQISLYMKVKGQAEEAVKSQKFKNVSIFRPGLLRRGEAAKEKLTEKIASKIFSGVSVSTVAKAMVWDAERIAESERPAVAVFSMDAIRKVAETGKAPDC